MPKYILAYGSPKKQVVRPAFFVSLLRYRSLVPARVTAVAPRFPRAIDHPGDGAQTSSLFRLPILLAPIPSVLPTVVRPYESRWGCAIAMLWAIDHQKNRTNFVRFFMLFWRFYPSKYPFWFCFSSKTIGERKYVRTNCPFLV